ncbi:MAG: sugar phosphate nucleotidyltransferase [Acidobacteriota bacterium]
MTEPRTIPERAAVAILAGGAGRRLWPLTRERAKPALPLAGGLRLVDVPLRLASRAGFERVFVLAQRDMGELRRHAEAADATVLTPSGDAVRGGAYRGSADAVRRHLEVLLDGVDELLILCADLVIDLDLAALLTTHRRAGAALTLVAQPITDDEAASFGVLRLAADGRVEAFVEKPTEHGELERLRSAPAALAAADLPADQLLGSAGLYVASAHALRSLLDDPEIDDFGSEIFPRWVSVSDESARMGGTVQAKIHSGYCRDLGTVRDYYESNLELAGPTPPLRFAPSPTTSSASEATRGTIIRRSLVGPGCRIGDGSALDDCLLLGEPTRRIEIGRGCRLRGVIVDRGARLGDGCRLGWEPGPRDDRRPRLDGVSVHDGVLVVAAGAELPAGTVL